VRHEAAEVAANEAVPPKMSRKRAGLDEEDVQRAQNSLTSKGIAAQISA